jgi:Sugar phosphate permease
MPLHISAGPAILLLLHQVVSSGINTTSEIGLVGTAYCICYGVCQIISGIAGDRVHPFGMVWYGALGSPVCCFSMAFTKPVVLMAVIWGAHGILQSMLWSPLLRVYLDTL